MATTRHRDSLATEDVAGKVELATSAELNTGSDATRPPSADTVAGSVFGEKPVGICVVESDIAVAIADGKIGFTVPATMDGMNLVAAVAAVYDAGAVGATTDIQLRRRRGGANVDMLSAPITIDVGVFFSTNGTIEPANDDITTGDILLVDVDAVCATPPNGLFVTMTFRLP